MPKLHEKESRMRGTPVLVTFDSGTWYYDRIYIQVTFYPQGARKPEIRIPIWRTKDDNLKGGTIIAARSEVKRLTQTLDDKYYVEHE